MNDPQRPNPPAPQFEVPDLDLGLDLEPAQRSGSQASAPASRAQPHTPRSASPAFGTPDLFDDDDASPLASLSIDVDRGMRSAQPAFGGALSFDESGDFDLEPVAQPDFELGNGARSGVVARADKAAKPMWPSGRGPDLTQMKHDPVEVSLLADYGPAPSAIQLTPAYALRVFMRQRELKRQLAPIAAECERVEQERETLLAELARDLRPAAEQNELFRRLIAPLLEFEQVASQRGQALSSANAQRSAHDGQLDAELAQIKTQIEAEQQQEQAAHQRHCEREAAAKRADAKLKRVHIEMRAVTQVAEQKLGPQGGQIPDAEAAQLAALRERAEGLKPEVTQAQGELEHAQRVLDQVRARISALQYSERLASRKKQAVGQHFQKELQVRSLGVTEAETQQRSALVELGRALLGAPGSVEMPPAWPERVRAVSDRADKLILRRELQLAAIEGYDSTRVAQGVRLAGTAIGLFVLLIALKLIF